MRIILTHEQADFDAIASLLGGYLLDDTTLPVLPMRMNRNVRAFITLYGAELPFVEARDLANESIEAITLVDTQSMVSLRGMNTRMQVMVVDHHPKRENLPADWSIQTPETGANTTFLVELFRESSGDLTPIQATMLLLGIYEDTGSLTYTRTTPRDLLAAAFLLENGANLQIAVNFLNHPLSPNQQKLYDQLRIRAETVYIHGHTVILACGDAQDMDEELSTIAHKLRDLLDPDALFMLVETRGGIHLIARSTSDQIDVAEVVSHFGGGGHDRAAASLIQDQKLEIILSELRGILAESIRPAKTVAQIMSRDPQLLTLDTPVEKAEERMRRYGYEGFPVVKEEITEQGKRYHIQGLLTRRSVDRSMAHKHYVPVSSLMLAGDVSITPEDSIEDLQRLMIDTGWGQVPVVDSQSGDIIGIVTRTDLLKTLSPQFSLPGRNYMIARLEAAIPTENLAVLKAISQAAVEQHIAVYIVGGFVRDLLLDSPSLDFDLVVEGDAIQLANLLVKRWGGRITSHSQFGTAKWHLIASNFDTQYLQFPLESIDLVSARTEFYTHPTALPIVERGSIKLDLHRRDFTMNTLALRLDGRHYGELHDYYGGVNDLRQGVVRVLHSLSFVDDPTRILRAVRFEKRFNFQIDPRTRDLAIEARHLIDRLSGDRVRHELNHILVDPQAAQIFNRLFELGFLQAIHPTLIWDQWLQKKFEFLPVEPPSLEWGLDDSVNNSSFRKNLGYCLLHIRLEPQVSRKVGGRLKLPSRFVDQIASACKLWQEIPNQRGDPPSKVVKLLESAPSLARFAAYTAFDDPQIRGIFENYAFHWKNIRPSITGDDLRARGILPGPIYREILDGLRNAWLDEEIKTIDEEKSLLEDLLAADNNHELP